MGYMDNLGLPHPKQMDVAVPANLRCGRPEAGLLPLELPAWGPVVRTYAGVPQIDPQWLEEHRAEVRVLDVREDSEFEGEGHVPHASHLYVGYLEKHLREITPPLAKSERVAVTCSVGHRASLAASILRREGFEHVDNVLGGMTAWRKLELPTEKGKEHTVTTPAIEGERK